MAKSSIDEQLGFVLACLHNALDNGGKVDYKVVGASMNLSAGAAAKRLSRMRLAVGASTGGGDGASDHDGSCNEDDAEIHETPKKAKGKGKAATPKAKKATPRKKRKLDKVESPEAEGQEDEAGIGSQ